MKRFLAFVLLLSLVVVPLARADGPDDQYVGIYSSITQGDALNDKGQTTNALAKYTDARTSLKRFQHDYPNWNVKVVKFRLKYLDGKIAKLSASVGGTNAPSGSVTNSVSTNAPAEMSTNAPVATPVTTPATPPATTTPPPQTSEPVTPPAANPSADTANQIKGMQDQIANLEADRAQLQAKLKEALAAQPAAIDPREFTRAQDQIRDLQKENELLKAGLAESKKNPAPTPTPAPAAADNLQQELSEANQKLSLLNAANSNLTTENASLQARVQALGNSDASLAALRDENAILKKQVTDLQGKAASSDTDELTRKLKVAESMLASLQSDKQVLQAENAALKAQAAKAVETAATPVAAPTPAANTNTDDMALARLDSVTASKIAQLQAQRDELEKNLAATTKDIYGRKKGKEIAARIDDLTRQLAGLRARIEIYETREVPYTPEELALLSRPDVTLAAHNSLRKAPRELPAHAEVLLAQAKQYFVAHDYAGAEGKYLDVLKLDDKNIDTLADLASIQLEMGKNAEAEKNIRTALGVEPNDDYSLYVLGQIKFREKKYDEALDALSHAAQLNPQNPRVQNFLGLTLSEKGMRAAAETAFRKAIQYDPGFAEAHLNLAIVYISQTPPLVELARWHYQKALAAGHPANSQLEKMLDPERTASVNR